MPLAKHTKKIRELGGTHNKQGGYRYADFLPSDQAKDDFILWCQENGYTVHSHFRDRIFNDHTWTVKFGERP